MPNRTIAAVLMAATGVLFPTASGAAQDVAAFQAQMTQQLRSHPFFRRVGFQTNTDFPPFVFFVQDPLHDDPSYQEKIVRGYRPFLNELATIFDEVYCGPSGLRRVADADGFAIAVLATTGTYDDFARAIDNRFLHQSRAHYDPELRLAVTHQVVFGTVDSRDERQALLHEFVHAMQHACSTTGDMPKPVWFNEGLAESRSSCTGVARTLRRPPQNERHVANLYYGYLTPALQSYMLPLRALVLPESYPQIGEVVAANAGAPIEPQLALELFYSQSEMVVRFLHEAHDGKYLGGVQRYFRAVAEGHSGLQPFRDAFGLATDADLEALEHEWLVWLTEVLRIRDPNVPDLAAGLPTDVAAAPLPPPAKFDRAALSWRSGELEHRIAAGRRLCSRGHYDAAYALLSDLSGLEAGDLGRMRREAGRAKALVDLREDVLADLESQPRSRRRLELEIDGEVQRVDFLGREAGGLRVEAEDGERRLPLTAVGPAVLLAEADRMKRFRGKQCWLEAWLRWLSGETRDELRALLTKRWSTMKDLRKDLQVDLADGYGAAGAALVQLQQVPLPDAPAQARAALAELQAIVARHGADPLLQARKPAIEQFARALGERGFTLADAAGVGIAAESEMLEDGRVRVRYEDPAGSPAADFALVAEEDSFLRADTRIAYGGPTELRSNGRYWQLIGSGQLRWAVPLAGAQSIEVAFERPEGVGVFAVLLCVRPGRYLAVYADGSIQIFDQTANIQDFAAAARVLVQQKRVLRIEHDGSKVRTFLDGKEVAELPAVGNCTAGELHLFVHSSQPTPIHRIAITGKLAPADPAAWREQRVQQVLQQLWSQPAAGAGDTGGPAEAAARPQRDPEHEVPGVLSLRRGGTARRRALSRDAAGALERGVDWLLRHQDRDGRWDSDEFMAHDTAGTACDGPGNATVDVGVTGLALLALLGEEPDAAEGRVAAAADRAAAWLLDQQAADGTFSRETNRSIYDHAIATLALAEAYALHSDPRVRAAAQAGLDYLEQHRNPYSVWGYGARDNTNTTALTAWCLYACWAGRIAGLEVNDTARELGLTWFDSVTDAHGRTGYRKAGEPSARFEGDHVTRFPSELGEALTAAALFDRLLLGADPEDGKIVRAAEIVAHKPPRWDEGRGCIDMYYWFFATHGLYQLGERRWDQWSDAVDDALVPNQRDDGNFAGSWDPVGVWGEEGGRVYATALAVMTLQAPVRYRRLVR